MKSLVELYEQLDEVNYFLQEWQRLSHSAEPFAAAVRQPEIRFVSHAVVKVIREAHAHNMPVILQLSDKPVIARHGKRSQITHRVDNVLIPPHTSVEVLGCNQKRAADGKKLTYIESNHGLFTLIGLARAVAHGARLIIGADDPWLDMQGIDVGQCGACLA